MNEERIDIIEKTLVDYAKITNETIRRLASQGGGSGGGNFVKLTYEEYKNLTTKDPNTFYCIINMGDEDEARSV